MTCVDRFYAKIDIEVAQPGAILRASGVNRYIDTGSDDATPGQAYIDCAVVGCWRRVEEFRKEATASVKNNNIQF